MQQKNFFILVGVLLMILVSVAGYALAPTFKGAAQTVPPATTAGIDGLGGAWTLTDHQGRTVTNKDYSAKFSLLFFGFTYCPDVCPTELKRLTLVLEGLGAEADGITPLFVTIDPARDTPSVLKNYLARFDERFIGLTGSIKQIEHMEDIYKVYSAKAQDPEHTEYTMNHSALVYLIAPGGKVLHLFHSEDTPDQIIAVIRAAMARG